MGDLLAVVIVVGGLYMAEPFGSSFQFLDGGGVGEVPSCCSKVQTWHVR